MILLTTDIYTQEVLTRHHELPLQPPTSTSGMASVSATIERLRLHEKRKAERRRIQMLNAREKAQKLKDAAAAEKGEPAPEPPSSPAPPETTSNPLKRAQEAPNGTENGPVDAEPAPKRARIPVDETKTTVMEEDESNEAPTKLWTEPDMSTNALLSKPYHEMRGHTSYLTFASYYPASIRALTSSGEDQAVKGDVTVNGGDEATEYGSDGIDEVMGTMTEDEIRALTGEE